MEGAVGLAEEVYHLPVRLGAPNKKVKGLTEMVSDATFSTGVGLILYSHQNQAVIGRENSGHGGLGYIFEKMKRWFQGNF